jgi:predicted AlkP superfamily pyrophosphatase or phosphodiesterase
MHRITIMDNMLVKIIEHLPEDSILFMFGDHGMTDGGNHGEYYAYMYIYIYVYMYIYSCL